MVKTNVMRILEKEKIDFLAISYDTKDDMNDGVSVAHKTGKDVNSVFKTLVTVGHSKNYYVYVIPVDKELNLKSAAKAASEKSIEMIKHTDLLKITGYIKGGCSPVGMKKPFKTFIHNSAIDLEYIIVSAGKIGHQVQLSPENLQKLTKAEFKDITV